MYDCARHSLESNEIEGGKTQMISKEQFLTIKRLKQEGVPIAAIARRIGISEPTTRKWANMSEAGFDELKKDDIPYLDNYREFILSILRVCPQTRETNILYRLREEFPDFECRKTTFYKYMRKLREQTGFVQFTGRVTSLREESPPGYEAQVDFGQYRMKDMYGKPVRVYFFCMVLAYSACTMCISAEIPLPPRRPSKPTNTPFSISVAGHR